MAAPSCLQYETSSRLDPSRATNRSIDRNRCVSGTCRSCDNSKKAFLGDAYASHLTLGFESINIFGTRGFSRGEWSIPLRIL